MNDELPTTIDEIVELARERLDDAAWNFLICGAGEEATVARNSERLRRLALVPEILRGVEHVDPSTELLGMPLAAPVMLAPVGSVALYDPEGSLAAARGAVAAGTGAFVGVLSSPHMADVMAGAPGPHVLQLLVSGDRPWMSDIVAEIAELGFRAVCITAETPVPSRRDRLIRSRTKDWRTEREGLPPSFEGRGRDQRFQRAFDWGELEWLRSETSLPIVLKGVMNERDAARAVSVGVDAVYVSNHGGRSLDHAIATWEALPDVVEAVAGRVPVLVDGGVSRGTDVAKAVALGASAVLVGRMQCWGLAVGGSAGVERVLEILTAEFRTAMALLGCRTVDELDTRHVRRTSA